MFVPLKMLCNCKITSCKIILQLDKLIKTGISSLAATLKVAIKAGCTVGAANGKKWGKWGIPNLFTRFPIKNPHFPHFPPFSSNSLWHFCYHCFICHIGVIFRLLKQLFRSYFSDCDNRIAQVTENSFEARKYL